MQIDPRRLDAIQLALDALELEVRSLDGAYALEAINVAREALLKAKFQLELGGHLLSVVAEPETRVRISDQHSAQIHGYTGGLLGRLAIGDAHAGDSVLLQVPVDYTPPAPSRAKGGSEGAA